MLIWGEFLAGMWSQNVTWRHTGLTDFCELGLKRCTRLQRKKSRKGAWWYTAVVRQQKIVQGGQTELIQGQTFFIHIYASSTTWIEDINTERSGWLTLDMQSAGMTLQDSSGPQCSPRIAPSGCYLARWSRSLRGMGTGWPIGYL